MTRIRPYLGTISGTALGIVTVVVWMLTFNMRPDADYSWELFPLSCWVLGRDLYSPIYVPFAVWYCAAFLQWLLAGISADLLRWIFRFYRHSKENAKTVWRCLALVGIGWAVLVPLFLFLREYNDSELKRFQTLEREMNYADSKSYMAIPIDGDVRVLKSRLERNSAEIRSLVNLRALRFDEFATVVAVSSIGIIALSFYVLRSAKR